jgi:peptidoglycan hydrolase-like protein with peptidoglycan-binding domain
MMQGVLKTGFGYPGAIDGVFGPVTETVVGQYQTNAGLPATGVVEERTWMGARRRRRRDAREPVGPGPLTVPARYGAAAM